MNGDKMLTELVRELDAFAARGQRMPFWWRDDDAAAPTRELRRLLDLQAESGAPLTLAVIPATATPDLARVVAECDAVSVVQHGYSHENHAPDGQKKCEFPADRPVAESLAAIRAGRTHLLDLCGKQVTPVFVPPWNRIAPNLLPHLPRMGLQGISTFRTRSGNWAAPGLMQVNTHLDPADWANGAAFRGDSATCAPAIPHMQAFGAHGEPLGLLTHHARHDEATWDFLRRFLLTTGAHPGAVWVDVTRAFGAGPAAAP